MAYNDLSKSKMTNMDPVMEPIFTKMIPYPRVKILKMIPCPAAILLQNNILGAKFACHAATGTQGTQRRALSIQTLHRPLPL